MFIFQAKLKMMKSILGLFLVCVAGQPLFAGDAIVTGKIGEYAIEVTLESVHWDTGELSGKYRYANKTSYLTLKGQVYGSCVFMQEFYHETETGQFYLDYEEGALKGKWIADTKAMNVVMDWTPELAKKLKYKQIEDFKKETNTSITGTYRNETYFLNEMWFTEENPVMEIGFNGGNARIEEIGTDSIHFLVEVICGLTYHVAYAHGKALKTGENSYYCLYNTYEGDTCEIFFNFSPKTTEIYAKSNNSFSCGEFGARAYLEHSFTKVNNKVDFDSAEE